MRTHMKTFGPKIRSSFARYDILHGIEDGKQPEWHKLDLIYEGRKREYLAKQAAKKAEQEFVEKLSAAFDLLP